MVDPLSMTSLGIQICQGLIFACRAWRDFDSDISNTCRAVEDLTRTLKRLESLLKSPSIKNTDIDYLQRCLEGCDDGLQSLRVALKNIEAAHIPTGPKRKAWLKLQRAVYPLNKGNLIGLQRTVASLQRRLHFALQMQQTSPKFT